MIEQIVHFTWCVEGFYPKGKVRLISQESSQAQLWKRSVLVLFSDCFMKWINEIAMLIYDLLLWWDKCHKNTSQVSRDKERHNFTYTARIPLMVRYHDDSLQQSFFGSALLVNCHSRKKANTFFFLEKLMSLPSVTCTFLMIADGGTDWW